MDDDTPAEVSRPGTKFGVISAGVIEDAEIPATARLLYAILAAHAGAERSAFPGRKRLAKMLGCDSLTTVDRARQALVSAGVLVVERRWNESGVPRSSLYLLHDDLNGGRVRDTPTSGGIPISGGMDTPTSGGTDTPTSGSYNNTTKNTTTKEQSAPVAGAPGAPAPVVAASSPSKRKTRFPDAFEPNATHWRIAEEQGVDIRAEYVGFKDHALANGRLCLDWDAAFRSWLRKARTMGGGRPSGVSRAQQRQADNLDVVRRMAERQRQQQEPQQPSLLSIEGGEAWIS